MRDSLDTQFVNEVPPAVEWLEDGSIKLIDQSLLPASLRFIICGSVADLADAIRTLRVRGAPMLGIAAAYGLCLVARRSGADDVPSLLADLETAAALLRGTRPTAVNLGWALNVVLAAALSASESGLEATRQAVYAETRRIARENDEANARIGEYGAQLLSDGANVLTHCNAGPLAAGGIGTALGAIYMAHRQGKRLHVWVDETRPLLQGARLTTWELMRWGVPCTLIADNMAASLMRAGRVDAVVLGADRIAANGDVANKIGTYSLAVLAHAHNIPFYVVAPDSSLDLSIATGADIKIEQRRPGEITHQGGVRLAPEGVDVYNPAFDVTPSELVSCIITESGIHRQPLKDALAKLRRTEQAEPALVGAVQSSKFKATRNLEL